MNAETPSAPSELPPTWRHPGDEAAGGDPTTPGQAKVALALGVVSLFGFFFPPCIGAAIAGLILGWTVRGRIAASSGRLRGAWMAYLALAASAVGTVLSLFWPALFVYVWIYAAFHGGQMPGGGF